jgi:DNA polymerase III gamma/tau subunit
MDNVKWHQVASLDGMSDMLYDINLWAKEAPLYVNNIGFTRKFVVLDEIQLLTSSHIQSLLGYIDITPKTTTWILISMDLSKLSNTILDALSSRCKEIELNSHTNKDCIDYVMDNWPLTYSDAKLLASLSEGNLRKISSLIEYCNTIDENKNVSSILLGNANNRLDLWHNLYNKNYKAAINICNDWLRQCNSSVLIKLLIDDIIEEISKVPNTNLIHDLDLLIKYSSGAIKTSLANYISLLYGFKQEGERQVILTIKDVNSFTSIKSLEDYYLEYCIY